MSRLAEVATAADCTHIAWVASESNAIGMGFYRRLGAIIVHQDGDAVTLQIDPTGCWEQTASANRPLLQSAHTIDGRSVSTDLPALSQPITSSPIGTLIMATNRPRCRDCETPEGELHALFCTQERCPFCGYQLAGCGCKYQVLTLTEEERKSLEEYIDDSVEPLRGVMARWEEALKRKGRVPYIEYPNVCARCGSLWPEFFRVPDSEWERYIQIDMRHTVICRPCFDEIKRLVDSHD